jgi:uncharacterized damage-inducible protein DinB
MARDPDSADCRQALLEIFTVNDRINQFILENLDPRAWKAKPPGRNPRTIAAIFTHVHNMRRKWLRLSAPHLKQPAQLDRTRCTQKQARTALAESAERCSAMLTEALDGGRVRQFRRDGWSRPWRAGAAMVAYMLSHEAHHRGQAPAEDQGVVFGVIQASPNSTIDQTNLFTSQVYHVYHAFPESQSIFQITSPNGGFGGMVTKPWSERKKTAPQLLLESTGPLSKIAGIRVIPLTPPPLPGGGDFPVDFVIASPGEPEQLVQFANQLVQSWTGR